MRYEGFAGGWRDPVNGNGAAASPAGILVVDATGQVFTRLRAASLGAALWRVTATSRALEFSGIGLAVIACYERPDWAQIASLGEHVPVVLVVAEPQPDEACRAMDAGAFGYIDASVGDDAFRRAMLAALRGEPAYSRRALAERLRARPGSFNAVRVLALTPRQREVVTLIAGGAADKEIARALGITTATAQKHVTNVLRRLNVPNRAAAVAVLAGIGSPGRSAE